MRAPDLGLVPVRAHGPGGPYVGTRPDGQPSFAREPALDALLQELHRGFGPQYWWPAETPFEVIVGAVLTQNTTWRNAELALTELRRRAALTPEALLGLGPIELGRAIRSSGTYKVKAERLGKVSLWYRAAGGLTALRERPLGPLREELLGVFGVGPETADSILCYAAGRRTVVVDTYARRLLGRHGFVPAGVPYEELRRWLMDRLVDSQWVYEEFHALCVRTGYDHCKPDPRCEACPATTPGSRVG